MVDMGSNFIHKAYLVFLLCLSVLFWLLFYQTKLSVHENTGTRALFFPVNAFLLYLHLTNGFIDILLINLPFYFAGLWAKVAKLLYSWWMGSPDTWRWFMLASAKWPGECLNSSKSVSVAQHSSTIMSHFLKSRPFINWCSLVLFLYIYRTSAGSFFCVA